MRSSTGGWPRAWPIIAVALLPAVLLMAVAGCGQQTDPGAQTLLKDASSHMSKAADVTKSIEAFNKQWGALVADQGNPQTAARLEQLFTTTRASEVASLDETKAARDDFAKAGGLHLSAEMKKYVDLRHEALDEQEQFLATELKAMDLRIKVAKGEASGLSLDALITLNKQINGLEEESAAHAKRAGKLHKEAGDYYREHHLGG